jgi:hypothetical protein
MIVSKQLIFNLFWFAVVVQLCYVRVSKDGKPWTNTEVKLNLQEMQQSEFVALHKTKAPRKNKVPRKIVESLHLSTMAVSYNKHFASYNKGKKHVIQLIPFVVWKQVYIDYQLH